METETTTMDSMELKISELIKEVHVDLNHSPSFTKLVKDAVSSINLEINNIPDDLAVTDSEAAGFVRDIGADKVEFKFKKPSSIKIGGSYSINCIVKPDVNVDLYVSLPKECFHEKDYLNHRYHAKRFLYLCIIKKYLKSSSKFQKVEFSTIQNEARKPVLHVYPAMKDAQDPVFFIRIIPSAKSLFNISKLDLKRNNLRVLNHEGSLPVPTPRYNTSILEDMILEDNAGFIIKTFLEWKELREALILLKVWARQRSSIYVHDCVNGYLLFVMLSYLVAYEKVNKSMRPLHMFRIFMGFIASSKLWSRGLYFGKKSEGKILDEERMLYKESFPVVICDTNHVNLAFRISNSGFFELQEEAALAVKCLETCGDGAFEDIFMTKIDFPAKYDYCIRLSLKGKSDVAALGFCLDDECWRLYEHKVHNILVQGLSDRAKFIRVIWRNIPLGCSIEKGLSVFAGEQLLVGISFTSLEKAFRVVDIGPDVENKDEALKFRKFWGEKAELRRFKDGKIAESTVWESEQWTRHLVLKRIIEHVLLRHLSLQVTDIVQIVDQLDFSLLHGVRDPMSSSASLLDAFGVLSKRLRDIEEIPLRVSSVQPLDPAFRFTSVFPPEPHPLVSKKVDTSKLRKPAPSCVEPLEVMLQLEGSGNWPMDDVAIEKTKSAFLLKIGESLQNTWGMTSVATEDVVDVFLSGYAFRLKIYYERLNLTKREVVNGQTKRMSSTDTKLFFRSQHSGMINGLQGRFPAYGPVVRLAKRWVASHMFSACLVEEAIELLVAYLFVKPLPFAPPCSRIAGFLRFLRLLADYDWRFSPLIVDINHDLSENDVKEIMDNFMLSRKGFDGNMQNTDPSMFLATTYDKASEAWTSSSPNSPELKRLTAYARSSANLLTRLVSGDQADNYRWECLFRTPLNNYNAVILLHGDRLPYPARLLFPSQVNQGRLVARGAASKSFSPFLRPVDMTGTLEDVKKKLMVDFSPLRSYIADLEKDYDKLKFWFDPLGGDAIGLTWEEPSTKKRQREVENGDDDDPVDMLRHVGEVGKGFVRSVHLVKSRRL